MRCAPPARIAQEVNLLIVTQRLQQQPLVRIIDEQLEALQQRVPNQSVRARERARSGGLAMRQDLWMIERPSANRDFLHGHLDER